MSHTNFDFRLKPNEITLLEQIARRLSDETPENQEKIRQIVANKYPGTLI